MQVGHGSECVEGLKLNWAGAGSERGIEVNLLRDVRSVGSFDRCEKYEEMVKRKWAPPSRETHWLLSVAFPAPFPRFFLLCGGVVCVEMGGRDRLVVAKGSSKNGDRVRQLRDMSFVK
ncbi:hypothetical protein BHM03_00045394 [Ensete ventricosum]|nr:hypothetical protein BHM03_00045394 [Ensete ventricosum]